MLSNSTARRITIWADTRGLSRCRSCNAAIEWAEVVASGKRMPFDGEIVPVSSAHKDGRLVEVVDTDVTRPHWASCPQAEQWRRGKRGEP
jgi:hypothetical protein